MKERRNRTKYYPAAILVFAAIGAGGARGQDAADEAAGAEKSAYDLGVASYRLAVEETKLRQQLDELAAATAKRQQELERQLAKLARAPFITNVCGLASMT